MTQAPDAANLVAERKALDDDIAALQIEPEAAEIVKQADEILVAHAGKVAALRAARDRIDEAFAVKRREQEKAEARQREQQEAALRRELVEGEAARLEALDRAQQHLRAFVGAINEAFAAHTREREIANQISVGARMLTGLSPTDFVSRIGGRIASILAQIKIPGALKGASVRIGSLELPNSSLFPADQSWREREEVVAAPAIQELIECGRR